MKAKTGVELSLRRSEHYFPKGPSVEPDCFDWLFFIVIIRKLKSIIGIRLSDFSNSGSKSDRITTDSSHSLMYSPMILSVDR